MDTEIHVAAADEASDMPSSATTVAPARRAQRGEYLAFRLGDEEYAIDILRVQEIRSYEAPTRLAGAPSCIMGVVNLRGVVVPVVDLRMCLGGIARQCVPTAVVVVLMLHGHVVGVVVDAVSEVIELHDDDLKPPPALGSKAGAAFMTGLACLDDAGTSRTIVLLDIEAVLGLVLP
ncbi:chemotaxis protein CheW [Azohydromonas sediminis]|uniref:chemotaxis protein CheW n=1 Tax=Azohydromonas sediminis TaxID=2259674 RepID=UPI001F371432|nr:chemotaxis protein CheW [Azohydromonas sediminis]